MSDNASGPAGVERPVLANEPGDYWGSDAAALMLRELNLPYVALNPGASYRGLHDSLVNLLGNRDPQMLLCLHEEHAVAIAHGYAKATGRADGRDRAQQCRADARDDGDVQRLVRPRAGLRARRHRAGRCREAPALDRLDPHRAGPGRAGPQFHQMGRPTGLGAGRRGIAAARLPDDDDAAAAARFMSVSTRRCRRAASANCRRCRMPPVSVRLVPPRPIRTRWPKPPRCCIRPNGR